MATLTRDPNSPRLGILGILRTIPQLTSYITEVIPTWNMTLLNKHLYIESTFSIQEGDILQISYCTFDHIPGFIFIHQFTLYSPNMEQRINYREIQKYNLPYPLEMSISDLKLLKMPDTQAARILYT